MWLEIEKKSKSREVPALDLCNRKLYLITTTKRLDCSRENETSEVVVC